jgi:hypothetical protein
MYHTGLAKSRKYRSVIIIPHIEPNLILPRVSYYNVTVNLNLSHP